jgi:DnaJ-class molecular chaperone
MQGSVLPNIKDLNFCPYQVLDLDPSASKTLSTSEINRAFRNLAKKYHPDKNPAPEAREKFERGKLASQVLLSDDLKAVYDAYLEVKLA